MTTALRTRLERFVALGKEATQGPWEVAHDGPSRPIIVTPLRMLTVDRIGGDSRWYEREEEDAAFIAAAPQAAEDIAALLAEVEALVAAVRRVGGVDPSTKAQQCWCRYRVQGPHTPGCVALNEALAPLAEDHATPCAGAEIAREADNGR